MILFYAQSENSEIVVTSPNLTFPGRVATTGSMLEPSLYGVQPVKYTLPEGTTKEFKNSLLLRTLKSLYSSPKIMGTMFTVSNSQILLLG